jgi:hypothetical protein
MLVLATAFLGARDLPAVDFAKQILPVLEKKCLDCHKAPHEEDGRVKKPKGGLRLDAAWAMLKGGETGPALVPGDVAKSYLLEVVSLPKDDDMFMPPKGDPLTVDEIQLLKEWIAGGADFGGWKGNLEGAPPESAVPSKPAAPKVREHDLLFAELEKDLKPAPAEAIEVAKAAGAQVSPLKVDGALLRVDFLTGVSRCNDENVAALAGLKEQLVRLDLGRTVITDASLQSLAGFPRLIALDLRQTAVTDAGLAALKDLPRLQTLNLFGTGITDAGLKQLAELPSLKQVYLFQTKATPAGLKQLAAARPGLQVSGAK